MPLSRRSLLGTLAALAAVQTKVFAAGRPNVLIAYYSQSGNTRALAMKLQGRTGGGLFEIRRADPYPADLRGLAEQSKRELETGSLPSLSDKVPDMSHYDIILVGGPVWWNTVSPPMMSFLDRADFAGRKVGVFATYSLAPSHYQTNFEAQARNAFVVPGLMVNEFDLADGRADGAIASWTRRTVPGQAQETQ